MSLVPPYSLCSLFLKAQRGTNMKDVGMPNFLYIVLIEKHILTVFIMILALTLVANQVDINCGAKQAKISEALKSDKTVQTISIASLLLNLVRNIVFLDSTKYIASLLAAYAISTAYQTSIVTFFREFLSVKFSKFYQLGAGSVHRTIERRSLALFEFLDAFLIRFLSNGCFLFLIFIAVCKKLTASAGIKITAILGIHLAISIFLRKRRSSFRSAINQEEERNSAMCFDILSNYESTKAYDATETVLQKYHDIMYDETFYKVIYELWYFVLEYFNLLVLLVVTYYILQDLNSQGIKQIGVAEFSLAISRLQDIFSDISLDIDNMFVSYSNLVMFNFKTDDFEENETGLIINKVFDKIEFKNVGYKTGSKNLLENVSFVVEKGKKIAVVGPSGGGKTTFARMFLMFYPYSGSIKIDNVEISRINIISLRDLISYVPQLSQPLNKTVFENLLDGQNTSNLLAIVEKCKNFKYYEDFKEIGFNKPVGNCGSNISGGQKNKLCFMRAIIKDAPLFILDRPCVSMDLESIEHFDDVIFNQLKDKTIINVVDNLTGLERYDMILYFKTGKLQSMGHYNSLLENDKEFREFCICE